jgi:hypothetical protein
MMQSAVAVDAGRARDVLEAAANQILSVVAPKTARFIRAIVHVADVGTAMTNGVRILLPPEFEGAKVAQEPAIAVGLLAHEVGHFLQPTPEILAMERQTGAPRWLANLLMDIQGEALMASLFPGLALSLQATRALVGSRRLASYVAAIHSSRRFDEVACNVLLAGRFAQAAVPFAADWHEEDAYEGVLPYTHTWYAQMATLLGLAAEALTLPPAQLPDLLSRVMAALPDLRPRPEQASPTPRQEAERRDAPESDAGEDEPAKEQDTQAEEETDDAQADDAAPDTPPEEGGAEADDQPVSDADEADDRPDGPGSGEDADAPLEADDASEGDGSDPGDESGDPGQVEEHSDRVPELQPEPQADQEGEESGLPDDTGSPEEGTLASASAGDKAGAGDEDEDFANPLGDTLSDPRITADGLARALQEEAQAALRDAVPAEPQFLQEQIFRAAVPEPQAARVAPLIQTRFDMPRGAIEIVAPGRFDRLEAARGNLPYRMSVVTPGGDTPAPNVVIAVDVSSSMYWTKGKIQSARTAAQAVALAVTRAGGKVLGLLFDDGAYVSPARDSAPLFAPLAVWPTNGGTSFAFLGQIWRDYPDYRVIVVTDGDGCVPPATEPDRERTVGVVIPGNDRPEVIAQVCSRVVKLEQLQKLPQVLAVLMPRSAVH